LDSEDLETLLTTWKTHDGLSLHQDLDEIHLDDYVAYYRDNILYFMNQDFSTRAIEALIIKLDSDKSFEPSKLVIFGYNFYSKHQREIQEALNSYRNKKSIEIDMVVRY